MIFLHFARKTFNPWAGFKTDSRSAPCGGPPGCRQEPFSGRAALPRSPLLKGGAAATALPFSCGLRWVAQTV